MRFIYTFVFIIFLLLFLPNTSLAAFTATIDLSSNSIYEGESIDITWSSTEATSCTGSGFSTGNGTSGTVTVTPSSTGDKTYYVTCYQPKVGSCQWELEFTSREDVCSFSSTCPGSNPEGNSCSSQTSSCHVASGSPCLYSIKWYGCNGTCYTPSTNDSETVTVNAIPGPGDPPVLFFSASPSTIDPGESSLLSWNTYGATICTSDDFDTGGATTSSWTVSPTTTTSYSLLCEGEPEPGQGEFTDGTWEYQFTDYTDYWCPRDYSDYPSCPSSNPQGQSCGSPSYCGVDSGQCIVQTEVYYCEGTWTEGEPGPTPTTTDSVLVTVNEIPELTAGTPSLYSGALVDGVPLEFKSSITNSGNADVPGSFDVRFQLDVGNNGVYDINFDSLDEISGLSQSQSKDGISQQWTAEEGTHAIRACADLPGDDVSEQNEGNNCSGNYVFTVNSSIQCQDGLDNNSNGLIDYPDDPACTSPNDNDEESSECLDSIDNDGDGDIDYPDDAGCQNVNDNNEGSAPPINFTFSANPALVRSGGTTALTWSVTAAKTGSCVITGNNGYYYDPTGNSGSVVTDPIFSKTIFTLTCEDLEGSEDSVSTEVQVIPAFKEI